MERRIPAVLMVTVLVAAGVAAAAGPVAAAPRLPLTAVTGSQANWATGKNLLGPADPEGRMRVRIYLRMRDQAGAETLARAVSSPGSPSFRKYLDTGQVRARFAPAADGVAAIRDWLAGAGFTPGAVPANHLYVEAAGTVEEAQHAFGIKINNYAVRGALRRAADRPLAVPARFGPLVVAVTGINDSPREVPAVAAAGGMAPGGAAPAPAAGPGVRAGSVPGAGKVPAEGPTPSASPVPTPPPIAGAPVAPVPPPPTGFHNSQPCSRYWDEQQDTTDPAFGDGPPTPLPYAPCGYLPGQLRDVYGLTRLVESAGLDGTGTTVAVVDAYAAPNLQSDATMYAQRNDAAHPLRPDQFSSLVFPPNVEMQGPDQCDASGWYSEQALDVEAVHAMAPGSHIRYVGAADCTEDALVSAVNEVVSKNLAQIITNSYGNPGEGLPADQVLVFDLVAVQAVLEGIGVYFSSGDSGDDATTVGKPAVDFSASDSWVTAVGGTSLGIGANGGVAVETGWETTKSTLTDGTWSPPTFLYGSGGGTSVLFPQPWYQKGVVPDALAKQNQTGDQLGRVVPDIAMPGDPNTGMLIGLTQTFPTGVAYDQYRIGGTSLASPLFAGYAAVADQILGHRHGFVNPELYSPEGRKTIRDVTHADTAVARVDYTNTVDASGGLLTSVRTFDFQGQSIRSAPGYDNVTGLGTPAGPLLLFTI
jgi:subtilase family serine protease